jgi:CRP/FNR family transcriptional regulator, nitrogen oxide reductase regulator
MRPKRGSVASQEDVRIIRRCPLFRGIRPKALATLIRAGRARSAERGDVLVRQGDPPARVYCLVAGAGKLIRTGPKGEEVVLGFLWPGDAFGYVAVLGGTNQQYTMQMTENGRVLAWDAGAITRMLRPSRAVATNALRLVATRLEVDWLRLQDLAAGPVERRVARALLRLVRSKGGVLAIAHQDLAEYVGTTAPTLSRILRRWKAQGLVDAGRAGIQIQDPVVLTAIAEDP